VLMLENAWYCVISPEGCAAILWNDPKKAPDAAEALKMTAGDLLRLGVVDEILPEPPGGAHRDPMAMCDAVKKANTVVQIGTQLRSLPSFTGCRELYKTGVLGTVGRIEQCRNNEKPYWYSYVKDVKPEDVIEFFLVEEVARTLESAAAAGGKRPGGAAEVRP